jgi:hypothetical protein
MRASALELPTMFAAAQPSFQPSVLPVAPAGCAARAAISIETTTAKG